LATVTAAAEPTEFSGRQRGPEELLVLKILLLLLLLLLFRAPHPPQGEMQKTDLEKTMTPPGRGHPRLAAESPGSERPCTGRS